MDLKKKNKKKIYKNFALYDILDKNNRKKLYAQNSKTQSTRHFKSWIQLSGVQDFWVEKGGEGCARLYPMKVYFGGGEGSKLGATLKMFFQTEKSS